MSSGRGDPRTKRERKQGGDLELSHIVLFLRVLAVMTGALLILTILFFLMSEKEEASRVAYVLTIGVNLAACVGSLIASRYLDRKDRELDKKEQEKYKHGAP